MDYREIGAVTGIGGLFQLVASKGDGAVVRSLADGKTQFVSARKHSVTPLESIEIYTTGDNVRLHEVLTKMKDAEGTTPLPEGNDPAGIKAYFETVFPEYDRDRVYASDLKKMVRWYRLLQGAGLLDFSRYQQQEAEAGREGGDDALAADPGLPLEGQVQLAESVKEDDGPMAPAQSPEAAIDAPDGEKPAKKARAKKSAEPAEGDEAAPKKTAKKKAAEPASDEEGAPKKTAKKKKDDTGAQTDLF